MNMTFRKITKFARRLAAYYPTMLPQGVPAFNTWADDIVSLYNFPDNDSVRFALATMIMHLGPTADRKAKVFFGKALGAAAAKQIAGQVFHDIKESQKKAIEAAAKSQ